MNKSKLKLFINREKKKFFLLNRLMIQEQDRINLWQRLEQMSSEKQNK